MKEEEYKVIKLRPQRVKGRIDGWVLRRDRWFYRNWFKAVNRSTQKAIEKPTHWMDDHLDS